jgi:mono/diheme cytochrome c family protein
MLVLDTGRRRVFRSVMTVPLALLFVIVVLACSPTDGPAPGPSATPPALARNLPFNAHATPEVGLMFDPENRLSPPLMSNPPSQAELGHYVYYMSCMVCHGNQGQGLTPEWRTVLDPADQNCWQSKCHAPNHPPEGFELPRTSPPVMGTGALAAYKTAGDLYEYLHTKMPWPFPGLFKDEEYWQLTAFLADANQVDFEEPLGLQNAANVLILPEIVQTHHTPVDVEQVVGLAVVTLLLAGAVLYRCTGAGRRGSIGP